MLYNKLIYTVYQEQKKFVLVGDPSALQKAVYNNYSEVRKTKLKLRIQNMSNKNSFKRVFNMHFLINIFIKIMIFYIIIF